MKKYRVALSGLGNRGMIFLKSFLECADRIEVAGICSRDADRLEKGKELCGGDVRGFSDAEEMLKVMKPDIFAFVTFSSIRKSFIELGAKYGVKSIIFEKPMAESYREAEDIVKICHDGGIKAVVSHQQKYLPQMLRLKEVLDGGHIGRIQSVHTNTKAHFMDQGTHFMDYALWALGGIQASTAAGHVHGRERFENRQPSADYLMGTVQMENDVRIYFESGYLSPSGPHKEEFNTDARIQVYGSHGYVYAETGGSWGECSNRTGGQPQFGREKPWSENKLDIQRPFNNDLIKWLDGGDPAPCNVDISLHGFEILQGLVVSALENKRADFPLADGDKYDMIPALRERLPAVETYKKFLNR